MACNRAVALLLFAALAACASAGHYYSYKMPKHYYPVPEDTYTYSGNIYEDFTCVKDYMQYSYYKKCNKYEAPKKVLIIECLLKFKCFDYPATPCCTSDGYQFQHICFAKCFGYKVVDITIGKCYSPPPAPSPVSLPPPNNCGKSLYCSDKQQCCSSYGYYSCCDKTTTCCGDKCCNYGEKCYEYVSYDSYGKKMYSYKCMAPPPPSPVSLPPPNNCGKSLYCSDKQQCCSSYGYYACCDKATTCCGDKCCTYGEKCYEYVSYDSYGKKMYSYKCMAPPPPSPVSLPPPKNCGKDLYCSDKQQCCSDDGYYACCDKYASCCGDQCCKYGEECYKYMDSYGKYTYTCKAKANPPVMEYKPSEYYQQQYSNDNGDHGDGHHGNYGGDHKGHGDGGDGGDK